MYTVMSAAETRAAENRAIEEFRLSEDMLIENAAAALAENLQLKADKKRDRIVFFCGGGNNGSDGLSAARMLRLAGYRVRVNMVSAKLNPFCAARKTAAEKLGVEVAEFDPADPAAWEGDMFVDAMLGIGLDRPVEGKVAEAVAGINARGVYTVAVDIPTGLNADTGEIAGAAVFANETVTFSALKRGHLLGQGKSCCGDVVVADIGIPAEGEMRVATAEDAVLPRRPEATHKGDYGRVRVVAGSGEMIGAALLASESAAAALRSGAGLVTLCVADSLKAAYQSRVRECTLRFLPDDDGYIRFDEGALDDVMAGASAIVLGMGMGNNPDLPDIIAHVASRFRGTLVLDADGLNALCRRPEAAEGHVGSLILTPHMGEFARLCEAYRLTGEDTPANVRFLAKKLAACIAAKSATTVISDGEELWLNATGTPAMAKGGSGDVLAGMVGAFATRLPPLKALIAACYHFGRRGEVAAARYGRDSLLASDIIITE